MKKAYLLLVVLFLITAACSDSYKSTLSITETNFEKEVPLQGNLIFKFNHDIVSDTFLGYWDTTNLITFTPEIQGRYKWQSGNTLIFSPINSLQPSTDYTAKPNKLLLKLNNDFKLAKAKNIEFNTPYINLISSTAYWGTNGDEKLVFFDLIFNYVIDPAQLNNKLNVNIDGEDYSFTRKTNEPVKRLTIFVNDYTLSDNDVNTKLSLKKGVKAINGDVPTEKEINEELKLQSPYKFNILDITPHHDGAKGTLKVTASQAASLTDIKDFITLEPNIKYTVQTNNQEFWIVSEEFKLNNKYEITINKGLSGEIGGTLKTDFNKQISFGKLKPSIKFANDNTYLSGNGNRNINIKIVNVEEIKVEIYKVYENNIIQFLSNAYDRYDYYNDSYYSYIDMYLLEKLGDETWSEEIKTDNLKSYSGGKILHIDFEDKLKNRPGFYVLNVISTKDRWLNTSKYISISDIGLIVKKGKNVINVFANSIKSANELPNTKIKFFGKNNQLTGTATTNENGVASFDISNLPAKGFDVRLITAKKNDDYNFLSFDKSFVSTSRFDVSGKYDNLSGFDAFIYSERDLYRPGETVNITGILRDKDWNAPSPIPVKLKITAPNGKEIKTIRKTLNNEGGFEAAIEIAKAAMTGNYQAQLYTSNGVFLGTKKFAIEEFMPDRIKVKLDLNYEEMTIKEELQADILAENYFGPPAANRNYEVQLSLKRKYFTAKTSKNYNYSIVGTDSYFDNIFRSGKTNDEGKAVEQYRIPLQYIYMGLLQGDVFVTVFDETGRPVTRLKTVDINTQDVYYGLGTGSYYVRTGDMAKIPLVAIDTKGNILNNSKAEITLIKHEWKTVLSRSGSYFRYRSEHSEKVIENKEINISAENTSFSFTPEQSGRYEVRISIPGVNTYVSRTFWSYGWGRTTSSSYKIDTEGHINIEFDKDKYEVGETAKVLLKAPFSGKILVTLEGSDVTKNFYLTTDERAASFDLAITDEYVPNIYITATLIKPHTETDFPLTVAHGFAPVMVENSKHKIDVKIKAADKSRSKTKQTIEISGKPNSAVTIAIVDEGILGITGYETPDPYKFFYRKKALQVKSYDLYKSLLPEINIGNSQTGGGDGMGLDKRINPLTNKRVKLVSFWSGIIETDSKGKAFYDIDIPQFSGSLRIMAVTYKGNSFGSASENIVVADPIVISTGLPRFFSPADTIDVPVSISNTTKKEAKCNVNISLEGGIDIIGNNKQSIDIPANKEKEVLFRISVRREIGLAKIDIKVNALSEEFTNTTDISIRPAAPLQKTSKSGFAEAGNDKTIRLDLSNFIENSINNKLVISKSPLIEFSDDLDYLVHYPYGCVEQTVSSVFPQLYFNDIVRDIYRNEKKNINPDYNIKQAINKLMLMQLYNGGLTYWPHHGTESWWGSVYACHFLIEAEKAGYNVNSDMLDKLVSYLQEKLKQKRTITYYYNINQRKEIVYKEVPYTLFVLAMAGKPHYSTMNYYKSNKHLLSLDGQYLLAAAYALSGNKKSYSSLLPKKFDGEESVQSFGGSFYSYIRDQAISLNAMLEVDPENEQIGILARHLTLQMKNKRYMNTQERAFAFLALGKIARMANESDVQAVIKSEGKEIAKYNNKLITITDNSLVNSSITIEPTGKGRLYYYWVAEGITADGSFKQEDSFLRVRKTFYDRNGRRKYDLNFKQNDLIVVKIEISSINDEYVDNVAITDILPAGFEIENSRLSEIPDMQWIKKQSTPTYEDIRDDRITLFVDVGRHYTSTYYYFVRAVSPGVFQMGPVGADAMYNGEYHSYNGAGVVRIE